MTEAATGARAGRIYAGESLNERTARRRQQFLDAGLAVFGTTGYRTATVRVLCRQAELTDRYFYESFDSIEDLLMAVYQQQFDQLQMSVLAALQDERVRDDPRAAVRAGLETLFTMASDPRVARVCWLEVLGVSPRVDAMYTRTFDGFADLVVGLARRYVANWSLDDDEARMLGLALVGAVSQTVTHWLLGQYRERRDTLVDVTARVFEGVLLTFQPGAVR